MGILRACFLLVLIFSASVSVAGTYYVASDGAAPWSGAGNCTAIETPCAISTSTTNAVAGDIVNLRGGTYNFSGALTNALAPANSGTSADAKITFQAYSAGTWEERETPKFVNTSTAGTDVRGLWIWGKDYIVVKGIEFENFYRHAVANGADYNEVSYCKLYHTEQRAGGGIGIYDGGYGNPSTHNWIHHNEIYFMGYADCGEGADLIKIGSATIGDDDSNFNTIENNTFYSAGHTLTDDFGQYNVWRNNIGHNEGWKVQNTVYGTATGGSSTSLIDTGTNFVTAGVEVGDYVHSYTELTKQAAITSIATTTNANDTLNYTAVGGAFGSPTFSPGQGYAIGCSYVPDPVGTNPGNGKHGHRCFAMSNLTDEHAYKYSLFEGNRAGHASINPANNGADNFTLGSPGNIVQYNLFFGADGPGINLKSYAGTNSRGKNNRIYNNTIYKNGQYASGSSNTAIKVGLQFYNSDDIGNQIKNNLFYQNGPVGAYIDIGGSGLSAEVYAANTWANNWCNYDADGCSIKSGDPLFTDPDLTDMTSTVLPDLTLQAGSSAKDAGGYLTLASGAGTSSTTLVVDDALYFQDGTWGSSLSNIQADWIKVGSVVVQISSINYTTNTITLASAISWADNAEIRLYKKSDGVQVLYGSETDMGAHEYAGATTHTITASKVGDVGTLTPIGEETVSDGADSVTYTATDPNGWKVTWSGTCGATGSAATYQKTNVTADCTVIATFTEIKLMPW